MSFRSIKTDTLVYSLLFVLLAVFLIHNFDSIGQDIGRHLKVGEIIWQTKEVPKTNLLSFTEPNFPFINHHWLSEVMFFSIFSAAGFTGLILVKVILILVAFLLLFFIAKSYAKFWPLTVSFLLSIFIFIQRTEVRPEIFSFVILAFFLFVLFRAKYPPRSDLKNPQGRTFNYLWFLPLAQLLWVNLHIYFFIGPFLVSAFLIDRLMNKDYAHIKKITAVLFVTFAATLINPNGIQSALLPFNVLNKYGYDVIENKMLSFLTDFFTFNLSIFIFKLSAAMLIASLILTAKRSTHSTGPSILKSSGLKGSGLILSRVEGSTHRIFEIIISVFFIYAGFKMLRNLSLYALVSFPVMSLVLSDIQGFIENKLALLRQGFGGQAGSRKKLSDIFKTLVSASMVILIFFVSNNSFYEFINSSKAFGFSVPNGLDRAVDFVKDNKIEGPMFNNFNIGGYLIWRFYPVPSSLTSYGTDPEQRVFVDNRPEAYSVKFFNEIYKPMQEDEKKWPGLSEKYGINFIFFGHTDGTPWGQSFLKNIVKNPNWKIVYINEDAIILVKNNKINSEVVSKFSITDKNSIDRIIGYVKGSNKNGVDLNLILSRVLYNIDWREASIYFADEAIKFDAYNPRAYLYKGLAYAYYTNRQNQELAAENIKKAIDLGLKDSQYYTILGIVHMNLGRLESARELFREAVRLDENNTKAKDFLNKYFSK